MTRPRENQMISGKAQAPAMRSAWSGNAYGESSHAGLRRTAGWSATACADVPDTCRILSGASARLRPLPATRR
ncbi:hypothetical protein TBS_28030 [Thermobispora bispora]